MAWRALPRPVVILDACILFQGGLTNLLLHLAEANAFEPVWSDAIHAEWMRNLQSRMGIPLEKMLYRRSEMERAFPAANVSTTPALVTAVQELCKTSDQRKDAHVVAAAIAAKASVILTHNTKDFAHTALARYGLSKSRPDPFCATSRATHSVQVPAGIRAHRIGLRKTPMSAGQYIGHLAADRLGMRMLSVALAPHQRSI